MVSIVLSRTTFWIDANIRIPGTDQYKDLGITNPQGIAVVTVDDNGELLIATMFSNIRKYCLTCGILS